LGQAHYFGGLLATWNATTPQFKQQVLNGKIDAEPASFVPPKK
jgi:hypothetical protein